ncbi:MAG: GNAT family N-acetyltransferase [Chloroflexi bacterium]|nr:GNAT family N-acetyltransferase [Chloroflexota bacterium]
MEQTAESNLNILQTTLGVLTIDKAQPNDLNVVMEILNEAAAWLHSRGITKQWPSPLPQDAWEFFRREIEKGDVYLARLIGDAVGTYRFAWAEPQLWIDSDGGYVHSFAIRPHVHGNDIGAAMMAWAKQHVRERGKKFLRLDCWSGNEPLKKYYAGFGFTLVRDVPVKDYACTAFQMEA